MKRILLAITLLVSATNTFSQRDDHSKFAIKFSPLQMTMGEFNFSYEQRVAKQSSVEFSIGPTISEVAIPRLMFHNSTSTNTSRKGAMGVFTSLGYRYYPLINYATAPRGLYFGPEIKYRLYTINYQDHQFGLGERTAPIHQFQFKFNTGYQFWFGEQFALDLFLNLGFGSTSVKTAMTTQYYDSNTNNWSAPTWTRSSNSYIGFVFNCGFKLGFGDLAKT